jgi:hypothetical protein
MFINFVLNSEAPAKFKCNPSLGAYEEESGLIGIYSSSVKGVDTQNTVLFPCQSLF